MTEVHPPLAFHDLGNVGSIVTSNFCFYNVIGVIRARFEAEKKGGTNLLPNSLHICYSTMGNDNSKDYGTVLISLGRRRTVRKGHRR